MTIIQNEPAITALGFTLHKTPIDDVFIIERPQHKDHRGVFSKTFNEDVFKSFNLATNIKESVYSISHENVLRGMHFQQHPYGQAKIISVVEGEILDVIVGIGGYLNSRNQGKIFSIKLSAENNYSLYIPDGYAHGFLCLSDRTIVSYSSTSVHNPSAERAIRYDSFGFRWPVDNPILSEKDRDAGDFNNVIK